MTTFPNFIDAPDQQHPPFGAVPVDAAYLNSVNTAVNTLEAASGATVHTTGAETIGGVKTFTSAPVVPSSSFPESAVANLTTDLAAKLAAASNLSDLASAGTARTNLGVLPLAGGTLTGGLTLNADPTASLGAATKQYVDNHTAINVKTYGALGTNHATADKIGIDAAVAAASATGAREVYFPAGTYRYDGILQINMRGLRFCGDRHGRPTDTGGTRINFYTPAASGAGIQIGTDDGQPYGNADYGGVQGFTLEDMSLAAVDGGAGNTTLIGSSNTYVPGSFGVWDWKGGDIRLSRTTFEHFDNGFFGVNSDLNRFEDTEFFYCKKAIFLGPRSDQFVSRSSYFISNDQDIHIDGARVVTFYDYVSNSSGSASGCPVMITGAYTQSADGVTFVAPWLEHSANPGTIDAWFDIGPSDSDTQIGEVVLIDPWWLSNRSTDSPIYHEKYLAKLGNAKTLTVRNPMGVAGPANVDALVAFVGTTSPAAYVEASAAWWQYISVSTNLGSGSPHLHTHMTTGASGSNQTTAHQQMSNLLIQKTDAAIGSGASILEVHRNLSGARALVINNSGNVVPQAGFGIGGRNLNSGIINGIGVFTTTWNPGTVTNGTVASTTVTCSGSVVGDAVLCGFSGVVPAGVLMTGSITASGTATVTAYNVSGSSWAPGSGTLRVDIIGH